MISLGFQIIHILSLDISLFIHKGLYNTRLFEYFWTCNCIREIPFHHGFIISVLPFWMDLQHFRVEKHLAMDSSFLLLSNILLLYFFSITLYWQSNMILLIRDYFWYPQISYLIMIIIIKEHAQRISSRADT